MRLRIAVAVAVAGLGLLALSARNQHLTEPIRELAEGECYAVDVTSGATTLDLPFDRSTRYLVILGSLAPFGPPEEVALSAEVCREPAPLAVRVLEPWHAVWHDSPSREPHQRLPAEARGGERVARSHDSESRAALASRAAPAPRTFFLHVTDGDLNDPKQYVRVTGREIAAGRRVRIYLDDAHPAKHVAPGLTEELVRLCDDDVIPAISAAIAPCRDVDYDGRFSILLTPWLNALQGGRTSLGGFVRSSDFDATIPAPLSNHGDILYLNATLTPGPHLKTLVAHEFLHAAAISARLPSRERPLGLPQEEDWISEGTAHLAENEFGAGWSNLDYRVAQYLENPARFPLVVPDYYRAGLWRCHGCRGATWLFLRWCADHAGPTFPRDLVHAPAAGIGNIENSLGRPFDEAFRRWTVALACSGAGLRRDTQEDYASLNLRGRLGSRRLNGPRIDPWNVDGGGLPVSLAPTAAAFLELSAGERPGTRRVRIGAAPSTALQVTILRWPAQPSSPRPNPLRLAQR